MEIWIFIEISPSNLMKVILLMLQQKLQNQAVMCKGLHVHTAYLFIYIQSTACIINSDMNLLLTWPLPLSLLLLPLIFPNTWLFHCITSPQLHHFTTAISLKLSMKRISLCGNSRFSYLTWYWTDTYIFWSSKICSHGGSRNHCLYSVSAVSQARTIACCTAVCVSTQYI